MVQVFTKKNVPKSYQQKKHPQPCKGRRGCFNLLCHNTFRSTDRQEAIKFCFTKLVHRFEFCKFLCWKTQKAICKPVGGFFHSWGCMMLQKHFMRSRGVFLQKYDYCRGFAPGQKKRCCTSTPGWRPHLGGVCAYFDTKHKGSKGDFLQFLSVRSLFDWEMKYKRHPNI